MKNSYKIEIFQAITGAHLFNVYAHDCTEDQAEQKATFWWSDDAGTRSTWSKF